MKNLIKKSIATMLALLLLAAPGMSLLAQEPTARNISVFRVDGLDARQTAQKAARFLTALRESSCRPTAAFLWRTPATMLFGS